MATIKDLDMALAIASTLNKGKIVRVWACVPMACNIKDVLPQQYATSLYKPYLPTSLPLYLASATTLGELKTLCDDRDIKLDILPLLRQNFDNVWDGVEIACAETTRLNWVKKYLGTNTEIKYDYDNYEYYTANNDPKVTVLAREEGMVNNIANDVYSDLPNEEDELDENAYEQDEINLDDYI